MRGQEFVVLSVMVLPKGHVPVMFMLYRPDEGVVDWAWHEAKDFEVLDHGLPSNWVYSASEWGSHLSQRRGGGPVTGTISSTRPIRKTASARGPITAPSVI